MRRGRVLGVDPLHQNGFKFLVYFLFSSLLSLQNIVYIIFKLNCCKLFEAFNPRINKAIILYLTCGCHQFIAYTKSFKKLIFLTASYAQEYMGTRR